MHCDDCGAIKGMNAWQGKQKYWQKTCPRTAHSTTYPTHYLNRSRVRATRVDIRQLTACATARLTYPLNITRYNVLSLFPDIPECALIYTI
jgi:hypothetical protein